LRRSSLNQAPAVVSAAATSGTAAFSTSGIGDKDRIAFCTMSRLQSRSGKMLIAASVMNKVSACPNTPITKTWLMRRAVRRPVDFAVTLRISSSVCRLPFINSSPLAP
jgi:hypothetical protein